MCYKFQATCIFIKHSATLSPFKQSSKPRMVMRLFFKDEKSNKVVRTVKTLFVLMSIGISFLIFSAPLLLVIVDTLLPTAFLSASLSPNSLNLQSISAMVHEYEFRESIVDVPLISVVRSAFIIVVYSFCDGPKLCRGPYMATTIMLFTMSMIFVCTKGLLLLSSNVWLDKEGYNRAMEVALIMSSLGFAAGHMIVAYRISCRERRKLLFVYRIDIEAVLGGKIGFPTSKYQKLRQEERLK